MLLFVRSVVVGFLVYSICLGYFLIIFKLKILFICVILCFRYFFWFRLVFFVSRFDFVGSFLLVELVGVSFFVFVIGRFGVAFVGVICWVLCFA